MYVAVCDRDYYFALGILVLPAMPWAVVGLSNQLGRCASLNSGVDDSYPCYTVTHALNNQISRCASRSSSTQSCSSSQSYHTLHSFQALHACTVCATGRNDACR
jgi:hypothetical protein